MNGAGKKLTTFKLLAIFLVALVGLAFFTPDIVSGQDFNPMLPDDPEQTPIDGGLGILAALGGTYAIKKLRDRNQE